MSEDQNLYRIGTVASLTGLSVERLRAWERRYDLSPAHKAGKTRFYSKDQLTRLKLIKHLIDLGQPISSLVALSEEQLEERIEAETDVPSLAAAIQPKIGLVGPNLLMLEQQSAKGRLPRRVEVVSRWANIEAFKAEQTATDDPQVLIFQVPVLSREPIEFARELYPKTKLVAIYQFATAAAISQVQKTGAPTLKWPITWAELEHVAITETGLPARAGRAMPRRYSDEELIAIASQSEDATNCPAYLVEAINQLNAFAAYAADCVQVAGKPDLYERVHADTTQARAQLEMALEALTEAEDDGAEESSAATNLYKI